MGSWEKGSPGMSWKSQFAVKQTALKDADRGPAPGSRRGKTGSAAVWQARVLMLVMINIAQLWILAATVDAALAGRYSVLLPLVISSGVCFLITLSIIRWWRPGSGKHTSTGYVRNSAADK
jgi:hypothetical protein